MAIFFMHQPIDSTWEQPAPIVFQRCEIGRWYRYPEYPRKFNLHFDKNRWATNCWANWFKFIKRRNNHRLFLGDALEKRPFLVYTDICAGGAQRWYFLRVKSPVLGKSFLTPSSAIPFKGVPLHVTLANGPWGHWAATHAWQSLNACGNFHTLKLRKRDRRIDSLSTVYGIVGGSLYRQILRPLENSGFYCHWHISF